MSEFIVGDLVRFKLNHDAGEFIVIETWPKLSEVKIAGFIDKGDHRIRGEWTFHGVELEKVKPDAKAEQP